MNLDEAIHARRSNRNFEECTISMQEIQQILEAGLLAPSAKNSPGFSILFITKLPDALFWK